MKVSFRCAQRTAGLWLVALVAGCGGAGTSPIGLAVGAARDMSTQAAALRHAGATQRLLYISLANESPEVDVYPADVHIKNPHLLRTITDGITNARGVAVDKAGTLYVVNAGVNGPGNVVEYANGSSTPSMIIPNIQNAQYVTVDNRGILYVSGGGNFGNNGSPVQVFVFAPHTTKLVRTITFAPSAEYNIPGGVAVDNQGDVFVGQFHRITNDFQICMAKADSTSGFLYIDRAVGTDVAIDGGGTMYVGDFQAAPPSQISVYPPGATAPSRSIVGGEALSVTPNGTLYAGYLDANEFDEYAPGATSPTNSFKYAGNYGAIGSAVTP